MGGNRTKYIHTFVGAHGLKISAWIIPVVGLKYDSHNPGTAHLYPSNLWHKIEKVMMYPGPSKKQLLLLMKIHTNY